QLTGTLSQVAGVRVSELADGRARGMRVADVWTGSGFRFSVLLDRALDIGAAEFAGKPLAWLHPALGTAAQHEPHGLGWLRTFGGGLLTTCGLSHIGAPDTDDGEALGLHGRISHSPAENIHITQEWRGDDYVLSIGGQARESVLFGENLLLTRAITTQLGASHLVVEDIVRNDGFRTVPHMLLYHCNFGFPVVSPDSELLIRDATFQPRDATAARGVATHARFDPPDATYAEQVFFHQPRVDADGFAQAAIVNRALNFGASVRYRAAELPWLWQWKMMGAGDYVCALEPANHVGQARSALRRSGQLRFIAPGEEVRYRVEIGVLADAEAVRKFEIA
ncbi:MAG: aldose 1-epimerase family protein, partial [Chloroflexota bacterium]